MEKAVTYAWNQKPYAETYLQDGRCSLSNNPSENSIRPFTVGRKNWLFCDTQAGARATAVIFSVLETAKANKVNPEAYLIHLLTVLPQRFAKDPNAAIDDLMPWTNEIRNKFRA